MNTPNQPMPPQGQPGAPVEEPKQGGSLKWLLIVLVIVIVAAALYWFFALR